jgi:putative nucleotidyltransferase with HDIG domain
MPTKNFNPVDVRDPKGEYVPVSIEGLSAGLVRHLELFVRAGNAFFLVKPKNMELTQSLLQRFHGKFSHLYIHASERNGYFNGLEQNVTQIIKDPRFSEREKASVLNDYAVEIVDRLLKDPSSATAIKSAKSFADNAVKFISENRFAFLHLVELSNHDHYTYAHSVGVAAYAVALAQSLGSWSKEHVAEIGLAGLLHDIGKATVDPAILNKSGPLTAKEWEQMKSHPSSGAELLRKHKNLSPMISLCAEAHHEDLRGLGYPKGLIASKLDSSVQVITIADAFSALTTNRSYSQARDSLSALKLMQENVNKKFDPKFFERFVLLFLDPSKKPQDEDDAISAFLKVG